MERHLVQPRAMAQKMDVLGHTGAQQPRQIPHTDVIIVFPYKVSATVRWGEDAEEEGWRGLRWPTDAERSQMETWSAKRHDAITALSDSGLVLMLFYSRDRDEIFCRVCAEEPHIRQVAEMKGHKLELKSNYFSAFAPYKNDYTGLKELHYADRRVVSHLYKAHVDGDAYPQPGMIFRQSDRIQLAHHIITSSDHDCAGVDIGQLMHEEHVLHYFPLHENRKLIAMDKDWFRCFVWGSEIDKVRDYFGERVAFYFLFMAHFNAWLILPAVVGIVLALVDLIVGTPDNFTLIFMCTGACIWLILFMHFWRCKCARHAIRWGTLDLSPSDEPTRPEFKGVNRINPVTGRIDRYYPWSKRVGSLCLSFAAVLAASVFVIIFFSFLFWMRSITGDRYLFQFLTAVSVELANMMFTHVAKHLTNEENHRTQQEVASHFMWKTVLFKFACCYFPLYFLAFVKDGARFGSYELQCVNNDCLYDVGSQLFVFMFVRLTLQNAFELGTPYFIAWYRQYTEGRQFSAPLFTNPATVMQDMSTAEKQSKMEEYDVYDDMDEILVLFGYCTLFVVAGPWVPVIALVSTVLECFLDSKKLIYLQRRPWPAPAASNEPWDTIFEIISFLGILTNSALAIFSSNFLSEWEHKHKIILFLVLEHVMILLKVFLNLVYPTIPVEVQLLRAKQDGIVHRHLDLGGEEDDSETRATAMRTAAIAAPNIFDHDDGEEDEDELDTYG